MDGGVVGRKKNENFIPKAFKLVWISLSQTYDGK